MRLRVTKIDEYQFLTCLKHGLWGSDKQRFTDWKKGDALLFLVEKGVAGIAEVSGDAFHSRDRIWDNGSFPHRIALKFLTAFLPENRPPVLGPIRDSFINAWGNRYGWGILAQQMLEGRAAEAIVELVMKQPNELQTIRDRLEEFIPVARAGRDQQQKSKIKPRTEKKVQPDIQRESEVAAGEDLSAHQTIQTQLIELGRLVGCSVWAPRNDLTQMSNKGHSSENECLKQLPVRGLDNEAMKRIGLIDVIWFRNNAPVCAFEIETSTRIFDGLLRMSDLVAAIPAIRIDLYVVAQRDREGRFFDQIERPTFQKIGLSEYCSFIPTDAIGDLLKQVKGLAGHVDPSVIRTIAVAPEDGSTAEESAATG